MIYRQYFTWTASLLVVALLGVSAMGIAQPAAPEPDATGGSWTAEQRELAREKFQYRRGRMALRHGRLALLDEAYGVTSDPARAAIVQMQRIERIYRQREDREGLLAFYQDVLARTDNLAIRNMAYLRMSELSADREDLDGALDFLEQGLEENLRRSE